MLLVVLQSQYVAHFCTHSTWIVYRRGLQVQGQPVLRGEILFQTNKQTKKEVKKNPQDNALVSLTPKIACTFYREQTLLVVGSLSAVDEFKEEEKTKNLVILCVFPAVGITFLLLFRRRKSLFPPPLCLIPMLAASR